MMSQLNLVAVIAYVKTWRRKMMWETIKYTILAAIALLVIAAWTVLLWVVIS